MAESVGAYTQSNTLCCYPDLTGAKVSQQETHRLESSNDQQTRLPSYRVDKSERRKSHKHTHNKPKTELKIADASVVQSWR